MKFSDVFRTYCLTTNNSMFLQDSQTLYAYFIITSLLDAKHGFGDMRVWMYIMIM